MFIADVRAELIDHQGYKDFWKKGKGKMFYFGPIPCEISGSVTVNTFGRERAIEIRKLYEAERETQLEGLNLTLLTHRVICKRENSET